MMRLVALAGHHEGQVESQNIVGAFALQVLADCDLEDGQELLHKLGLVGLRGGVKGKW